MKRLVAALAVLASFALPAQSARALASPVHLGKPSVRLAAQTTWVRSGSMFSLDVALTTPDPGSDELQVAAYPPVTTRSGFEAAANGTEPYSPTWYDLQPVAGLPAAPSKGAVEVRVPVDPTGSVPPGEKPFFTGAVNAVYPLQIQLFDKQSDPLGKAITTFLVFDAGTGSGFQRLSVALVVPLGVSRPVLDRRLRPVAPPRGGIDHLTQALAGAPGVPVSVEVDPEAVAALAADGGAAKGTVAGVGRLLQRGDELLPGSYVPVVYRRLEAAGLGSTVATQLGAGNAALQAALGVTPDPGTWATGQVVDDAALVDLRSAGLRRLVVPDAELSPLPAAYTNVTFGRPTLLAGEPGADVWGADTVLSRRLAARDQPVLAAEQDLAELAVTQAEEPSVARGVALLAPPGVSPALLATLVQGLRANPFAVPVTVADLFRRVHLSPGSPTRALRVVTPPAVVPDQPGVVVLSGEVESFRHLVPSDTALAAAAERAMLAAESSALTPAQGSAIVRAARAALDAVEHRITLPQTASITFTARSGTLPVTVQSLPHTAVRVELVLYSPKLQFRRIRRLPGACRTTAESETCQLRIDGAVTVVRVPVVSRTSGVFTLQVDLLTPDGNAVLASERDTIRSTAVSWVGLVLMIGAGLSLLVWWVRNARHGRRARQLVPPPDDEPASVPAGMSPSRP